MLFRQDNVDNITRGFWLADEAEAANAAAPHHPIGSQRPLVRRAVGGLSREARPANCPKTNATTTCCAGSRRLAGIWKKWHDMQGDNPPLERNTAGPRRDFDINLDGLAHYGLLPDFLQDMRNQGLAIEDFAPLFRSANDYVEVWAKCEQRSAALAEANPDPTKSI